MKVLSRRAGLRFYGHPPRNSNRQACKGVRIAIRRKVTTGACSNEPLAQFQPQLLS
jgi:hypothetical protein